MDLLFTIISFFILFVIVEIIQRRLRIKKEHSRKAVHISSAIFVFFLPYYLTVNEILLVVLTFTIALYLNRTLKIFKSIHSVARKTMGEVFFPLGVGLSALFFLPDNVIVFQFGILIMGMSDALADIVGSKYGKNKFKFINNKKSREGSLAFFISAFVVILLFNILAVNISLPFLLIIPFCLTLIELFLSYGLDNLFLPFFASTFLQIAIIVN